MTQCILKHTDIQTDTIIMFVRQCLILLLVHPRYVLAPAAPSSSLG